MTNEQAQCLLESIVRSCYVVELPNGLTIQSVPQVDMDEARELLGIPNPEPMKLPERCFIDPELSLNDTGSLQQPSPQKIVPTLASDKTFYQ